MDDLSICVVILTVNQRDKTVRCLRSLADVDRPDFDIVVWDNGSSDGTIEEVRSRFPNVHVHAHPMNIGAAAGRNAAVDVAMCVFSPRLLLFLDNDMVVDPGFLEALAEPFRHGDPVWRRQPPRSFASASRAESTRRAVAGSTLCGAELDRAVTTSAMRDNTKIRSNACPARAQC